MILFSDIFDRAIFLFDDPDLNFYYNADPVGFQKVMLRYLLNGKERFSNPIEIASKLNTYSALQSMRDDLVGTGSAEVEVDEDFVPVDNCVFSFKIDGKPDPEAVYDSDTKKVIFSRVVPEGTPCSVEYCYAGAFTDNISWSYSAQFLTPAVIQSKVIDIMAHCTLLAWCEKEKNFILDIRNLLTDTDFKIYSPANSIKAKLDWFKNIQEELDDLICKLGWDMRGTRKGGF